MTKAIADLDTPVGVIAFARDRRRIADQAEVDLLHAALAWADLHPVDSIQDAATVHLASFGDTGLLLGGDGCPLVAEFAVAEFAAAVGLGTEAGKHLIGLALELAHRLPRLWARVQRGQVKAWKAKQIAEATLTLSIEAVEFVDTQIAGVAHSLRPWQVDKLVAEAVTRYMPETAEAQRQQALDSRHVTIDLDQPTFAGTARVDAELDLPDALDLEAAIAAGAATRRELGSNEPLDVRRAMALGDLARGQAALPLTTTDQTADQPAPEMLRVVPVAPPVSQREVVLHVHLSEAAVFDDGVEAEVARIDTAGGSTSTGRAKKRHSARGGLIVTADTIRGWCGNDTATITVKPVLDLAGHQRVDQYEVPDRLKSHIRHRDGTCVFPWCTRPAALADCDHIRAHNQGGVTCTCNLAALCRQHHRLKTHGHAGTHWTYTMLDPGTYLWSSPHGLQFLRDKTGTRDVSRDAEHQRHRD